MIERSLFTPEHQAFRDSYQRFADKEITPYHEAWEDQGYVDREVWRKAGANGFLCMTMPEAYGGAGADRLYAVAEMEVNAMGGYSGIGFGLHNNIVAPYITRYGTEAQKRKYLPGMARGETIGAIAMSEPAAGSDLQGMVLRSQASRTRASRWPNCKPRCRSRVFLSTNAWSWCCRTNLTPPPPAWPSTGAATCNAR